MSVVTAEERADWAQAWSAALDDLELDVSHVEGMLAAGRLEHLTGRGAAWSAPALPGPLPPDLRERAAAILARQMRAAEALAAGLTTNRRQQALAARMDTGTRQERPVFVDQAL